MMFHDNKYENFDLWHKRGFTKGARLVMHREPWNIVWCLPLWAAIFKPITKFGAIWQSSLKEGRRGLRPEIRHYSGSGDENRECSGTLVQGGQWGGWSNCLVLVVDHLMLFWSLWWWQGWNSFQRHWRRWRWWEWRWWLALHKRVFSRTLPTRRAGHQVWAHPYTQLDLCWWWQQKGAMRTAGCQN